MCLQWRMGKGIPRLDLQFYSLNGMVNLGYWAEPRRQKIRAPEVTVKSFKGMRRMWARVPGRATWRKGRLREALNMEWLWLEQGKVGRRS